MVLNLLLIDRALNFEREFVCLKLDFIKHVNYGEAEGGPSFDKTFIYANKRN